MKISVVTAAWNSGGLIAKTVENLMAQRGVEVEHLLVDNASKDQTVAVAKGLNPAIRIVSEPDNGIYDAFNKGWRLATGDVVAFLGAGDTYCSPGTLAQVARAFADNPDADVVHGDIMVGGRLRHPGTGFLSIGGLRIFHPATFMRRGVLEALGGFDTRYRICSDLDLFLRAAKAGDKFVHLDAPLANFSLGGVSTTRLFATTREAVSILRANGYPPTYVLAFQMAQNLRDCASLARRACAHLTRG